MCTNKIINVFVVVLCKIINMQNKEKIMERKKEWETLFKWASKSKKNRKNAIICASNFIHLLVGTEGKKLSKRDLEKIAGGVLPSLFPYEKE